MDLRKLTARKKVVQGYLSQRDDDLGLNNLNFLGQPGCAGRNFLAGRWSIATSRCPHDRSRLDSVGHVNVRSRQSDRGEQLIEHLARAADEGFALQVFLASRRFADEDDICVDRSSARNGLCACEMQRAPGARSNPRVQVGEPLVLLRRRRARAP